MANKAMTTLEELENPTPAKKTLEEVRSENCINIVLPYIGSSEDEEYEQYEFVTSNGVTTQIRKGEVVAVNWKVYQELKQSDKYKNVKIIA